MKIEIKENKKRKKNIFENDFTKFEINFGNSYGIKKKEKLYSELKILLDSKIDIKKAIDIIINQSTSKGEKKILFLIQNNLLKGNDLATSFELTGKFSDYEIYTIKIGEETNNLNVVFDELRKYYNNKIQLNRQIISLLTYPIFVISITIIVLIFMLKNVVPMFSKIFKQFGGELPNLTKKVIYFSNHLNTYLMFFFITFVVMYIINSFFKNNKHYRHIVTGFLLRIPYIGSLIKKIYLERFSQMMSLLLSSKISLIESLEMIKNTISFYPIESSLNEIIKNIVSGQTLGESLSKFKIYDKSLVTMIKVSEEVNEVDKMFKEIEKKYRNEIDFRTKTIGVIIEPIIIVLIGIIVGVIMISMYLPMFDLSKILNKH